MSRSDSNRKLSGQLKALRHQAWHPGEPDGPPWRNDIHALIAIFALAAALTLLRSPAPQELSYTELKQAEREDRIAQVTFAAWGRD
ncbi:hypothetical protein Thiowin_03435 [Thiorhodovibrio winogradskyi]|uniref:Uncharacterized protein n=1 Tax=Thiorhodovibrio winogradskyi TaxID=77007 RepID=A0ABZ0SCR3_9GAMM|nr:hypothetical protein [Thiorhodovibrio winogradskyi]